MQKLVLIRDYTDHCTYYSTISHPFQYESLDKAVEDMLTLLENQKTKNQKYEAWAQERHFDDLTERIQQYRNFVDDGSVNQYIEFLGQTICFDEEIPNILTLEEWFQQNRIN